MASKGNSAYETHTKGLRTAAGVVFSRRFVKLCQHSGSSKTRCLKFGSTSMPIDHKLRIGNIVYMHASFDPNDDMVEYFLEEEF